MNYDAVNIIMHVALETGLLSEVKSSSMQGGQVAFVGKEVEARPEQLDGHSLDSALCEHGLVSCPLWVAEFWLLWVVVTTPE